MKIAFTADIHADTFSDFAKDVVVYWDSLEGRFIEDSDGDRVISSRYLDILKALCDIRDYCITNKVNFLFVAGDTFHKRGILKVAVIVPLQMVFESFEDNGIQVVLVGGNHDYDSKSSNLTPYASIECFRGVVSRVILAPEIVEIEDTFIGGVLMWLAFPGMRIGKNI